MAGDRKHIFISHIHEDDGRLSALKDLMKRKGLEVRDSSINSSKPNKTGKNNKSNNKRLRQRQRQLRTESRQ